VADALQLAWIFIFVGLTTESFASAIDFSSDPRELIHREAWGYVDKV
jgi:hypothetical protein